MTVYFIAAEALQVGYLIVSAHRDPEPDGRLKPDQPFLITQISNEYSGGMSTVRATSHLDNRPSRHYQSHERVAVQYVPIEGDDLDAIESAIKVLTRFGYKDQGESIRSVVKAHNTPPPEDAVEAPGWGQPGRLAPPAPLPPQQGFSLQGALAPLSQEPPATAAPPSPFTR